MAGLPDLVEQFVDAVNRGDVVAFMGLFAADAVVDDWGARHVGHAAIEAWSERELVGAGGRLTPLSRRQRGADLELTADWASSFYSARFRYLFVVDGGLIRELRVRNAR